MDNQTAVGGQIPQFDPNATPPPPDNGGGDQGQAPGMVVEPTPATGVGEPAAPDPTLSQLEDNVNDVATDEAPSLPPPPFEPGGIVQPSMPPLDGAAPVAPGDMNSQDMVLPTPDAGAETGSPSDEPPGFNPTFMQTNDAPNDDADAAPAAPDLANTDTIDQAAEAALNDMAATLETPTQADDPNLTGLVDTDNNQTSLEPEPSPEQQPDHEPVPAIVEALDSIDEPVADEAPAEEEPAPVEEPEPESEPAEDDSKADDEDAKPTEIHDPAAAREATSDLDLIKQQALRELAPIANELDQEPNDRFHTLLELIQATDNQDLVQAAFDSAQAISSDKERAAALLNLVNEVSYLEKLESGESDDSDE